MTVVECRDLQVPRGERIVIDDLSLVVRAGEWVALVGPNGAGKTTFLHAVSALLPSSGWLSVLDHDPRTLSRKQLARLVALMPQHPVVPPGMVVRDLVMLGRTPFLGSFATESPADRAAVDAEIAHLGLESLVDRAADSLSGGELQRVMLARALCQQPHLLLLDEPTSALDIGHQQGVLELVDRHRRQRGITVLAAMHDLTLAAQYADRVVLLDQGRVVADGAPEDVLEPDMLARTYAAQVEVLSRPAGPAVIPVRGAVARRLP